MLRGLQVRLSYCRTVALLSHPGHARVSAELGPRRRSGSHRRRIPVAAVLSGGQVRAAWVSSGDSGAKMRTALRLRLRRQAGLRAPWTAHEEALNAKLRGIV